MNAENKIVSIEGSNPITLGRDIKSWGRVFAIQAFNGSKALLSGEIYRNELYGDKVQRFDVTSAISLVRSMMEINAWGEELPIEESGQFVESYNEVAQASKDFAEKIVLGGGFVGGPAIIQDLGIGNCVLEFGYNLDRKVPAHKIKGEFIAGNLFRVYDFGEQDYYFDFRAQEYVSKLDLAICAVASFALSSSNTVDLHGEGLAIAKGLVRHSSVFWRVDGSYGRISKDFCLKNKSIFTSLKEEVLEMKTFLDYGVIL